VVSKPKKGISDIARKKRGPIDKNGKRVIQGAAVNRLQDKLCEPGVLDFIQTSAMYGISQRSLVAGIKQKFGFDISVQTFQVYVKRNEQVHDAWESGRGFLEQSLSQTMVQMAVEDRNFSALRWLYATKFGVYERHSQPEKEPQIINAEVQPQRAEVTIYIPDNGRDPGANAISSEQPPQLQLPSADRVIRGYQ